MPPSRLLPRTPALAKTFVPSGLARVAPVGPAPVRPRFAPSGAGVTSVSTGYKPFTTSFLIVGATPTVNRGAFPGRLAQTIRDADIVPGGTADVPAAYTTIDVSSAPPVAVGVQQVPATRVTISGRLVVRAGAPFTDAMLNRAIARAFANNVTWSNVLSGRATPPRDDGSGLLNALTYSTSTDYSKVYASGSTRIGQDVVTGPATPTTPVPLVTGQGPTPGYNGPVMTPLATSTPTPPICTVYPSTSFHIRPSPMDTSNTGAVSLAAGTAVQIISPPNASWPTSGTGASQLRVYWVQAPNPGADRATRPYVKGYATLANSTVASCAAALGTPEAQRLATAAITGNVAPPTPTGPSPTYQQVNPTNLPGGVGGLANAPPNPTGMIPGTNTPLGTTSPNTPVVRPPATPANIPNSQMSPGQILPPPPPPKGTSPWVVGGIAAAVAVVLGVAYVKRDEIRDAVQKGDKKKSGASKRDDE